MFTALLLLLAAPPAGSTDETPQQLVAKLADKDEAVRKEAARQLAGIGAPAVTRLAGALKFGNADLRRQAAEILGRIGNAAVDALPR